MSGPAADSEKPSDASHRWRRTRARASVALVRFCVKSREDEGSLLIGEGSAVKTVLDALDQGSGFLPDDNELQRVDYVDYIGVDADEYFGMTLNRAHGGFYAFVMGGAITHFDGCCWSSGWSASMDSGSDVHLTMIFPFAQEKTPSRRRMRWRRSSRQTCPG